MTDLNALNKAIEVGKNEVESPEFDKFFPRELYESLSLLIKTAEAVRDAEMPDNKFDPGFECSYDNKCDYVKALDELRPLIAKAEVVLDEMQLRYRSSHHPCCQFPTKEIGKCDCETVMKKELQQLRKDNEELRDRLPIGAELGDIIYCVTQYLSLPDNEVALLNKRIYDAIHTRIHGGGVMKYRKKPVVIEAMKYTRNGLQAEKVAKWCHGHQFDNGLIIHTLEGDMRAEYGDWIIKGVQGEFYPCKPDIFAQTYELAE